MYLSAERVAIVNQTIRKTFEETCIAWQAIPHWDTGDPGQTEVSNENLGTVAIQGNPQPVNATVAQLLAPTPDSLLTSITGAAVALAASVDAAVFPALRNAAPIVVPITSGSPPLILNGLLLGRAAVENAGFRAQSSLFADTPALQALYQLVNNCAPVKEPLLDAGNINSLYRVEQLGLPAPGGGAIPVPAPTANVRGILLGRRQRIAPGYAAEASPGEEPVDLAITIPPSFEVVGETAANTVRLNVRFRYALRVKTAAGLVVFSGP